MKIKTALLVVALLVLGVFAGAAPATAGKGNPPLVGSIEVQNPPLFYQDTAKYFILFDDGQLKNKETAYVNTKCVVDDMAGVYYTVLDVTKALPDGWTVYLNSPNWNNEQATCTALLFVVNNARHTVSYLDSVDYTVYDRF